ncbi:MAG: type VI secretion system baseplate subunit TssG [Myxococcales bacterium]|nr:type VI secretion system baseplate subunit TssG [Myxococcales bacterium]
MATDDRTAADRLKDLLPSLAQAPEHLEFLPALRRIECVYRNKPLLGRGGRPSEEPVRLGQAPSLAFAPSSLSRYSPANAVRPARLEVSFFGVFGPNGPLPLHLTEHAHQRLLNHGDETFARFADIFHHRLLTAFYRAWADARPTISRDRPQVDRFAMLLSALVGIGMPSLRGRDSIPDDFKLYFAGRFSALSGNAEGLRGSIADLFAMPTQIEQFVGEWLNVPEQDCWRLGAPKKRGARRMGLLGHTTLVGRRVWERQHKFRVVLGPLRRDQFDTMLPSGRNLSRLSTLIRNYSGDQLRWDLRLVLKQEAVKPVTLGRSGRLGRTSFLVRDLNPRRWDDVLVDPELHVVPEAPQAGSEWSMVPSPARIA